MSGEDTAGAPPPIAATRTRTQAARRGLPGPRMSGAASVPSRLKTLVDLRRKRSVVAFLSCALMGAAGAGAACAEGATVELNRSGVTATLEYESSLPAAEYSHLIVSDGGRAVFDAPLEPRQCVERELVCNAALSYPGDSPEMWIALFPGQAYPTVLVDLSWGGAHCCFIADAVSLSREGTKATASSYGNGSFTPRLRSVRAGPSPAIVGVDDRFEYAFTDFGDSGVPIRILTIRGGRFVNVTGRYRRLIANNGHFWWEWYRRRPDDDCGFLAAWAADEYQLRHRSFAHGVVEREIARRRVKCALESTSTFGASIWRDLKRWGYG